ncbi:MAG TPA: YceI family protein [Thermoanaerobaculia bacterium]|nr:YceI family protein [Thermoanaerobaculia bacterium]
MRWEFEPGHTAAAFRCRHMMVTWVRGHFKNIRGTLEYEPGQERLASVETEFDAASLWTGEAERDAHLRSADFLDVVNHPKISFRSTRVELLARNECTLHGELTIRGTTRSVPLHVRYFGDWETPYWEEGVDKGPLIRAGFEATTVINRHDFGVSWNAPLPAGGFVVGDQVWITIDVEALRKR